MERTEVQSIGQACVECECVGAVVVYTIYCMVHNQFLNTSPFPPFLLKKLFPPTRALVQAKIRQFDPPQGHLPVGNFGGAEPTMYSGAGGTPIDAT